MIITEYELRANWHKNKEKVITIPAGSVITPSARDFIRQKGIEVQIEGNGMLDLNKVNCSTSMQSVQGGDKIIGHREFRQQPVYYPPVRSDKQMETAPSYSRRGSNSVDAVNNVLAIADAPLAEVDAVPVVEPKVENSVTQITTGNPEGGYSAHDEKKPVPKGKPEHMTHLHGGNDLVPKTHPVIGLRGQLDIFDGMLAETQCFAVAQKLDELVVNLEEIAKFARDLMVAEVTQKPFIFDKLIGLTPDELREHSHHPEKHYGVKHQPIDYRFGLVYSKLHQLRAKARETELHAAKAFIAEDGSCSRPDIIMALNRLSSTFYILACKMMKLHGPLEKKVPVSVSNRHIHLSQADIEKLFGPGAVLTAMKNLSQPGQFAANEKVSIVGPKGSIEGIRILGPARKETQVELSGTDCYKVGISPVVRDSGQIEGTPGAKLVGPAGEVELSAGVMVASRHIHLHTDQAKEWNLVDKQKVRVQVQGLRPIIFDDVLVRVAPTYAKDMHIDTDEANAALLPNDAEGIILEG